MAAIFRFILDRGRLAALMRELAQKITEQVPQLAREIELAVKESGVSYETLAGMLQAERLRTLREKYPDFAGQNVPSEAA